MRAEVEVEVKGREGGGRGGGDRTTHSAGWLYNPKEENSRMRRPAGSQTIPALCSVYIPGMDHWFPIQVSWISVRDRKGFLTDPSPRCKEQTVHIFKVNNPNSMRA